MLEKEAMLHYPNFLQPFENHADASNKQFGAVLSQNAKPLSF